jgi:hypothetical protein
MKTSRYLPGWCIAEKSDLLSFPSACGACLEVIVSSAD